ncbi:GDSL-type esterase/lipase family protein [Corynebacterium guangdongense]|uniref:Lysophospholipase L1-like esterase n=1 Tax=Corynebacterium guangdongense TaxID=1783348 RepID=A0ABU1ZWJ0_9CORY|nr:GDSL-type esterase/lipase family protein [Corynebacterium guangdongense]MDR7329230.1 lysophospholipase L1-like esterase [Corynebacterium guangdongense]WJZ17796.1 hypothetical protein CGUA_06105 [Corynebacterium guangdongense]
MSITPPVRRHTAVLATVLLLLALVTTPAPARAGQAGNVVTFGDSYTASPDQLFNHYRNSSTGSAGTVSSGSSGSSNPLAAPDGYPSRLGCLQAPTNWPRQLAAQTGLPVDDWSCTAETSQSVLSRIDAAIGHGDIHASTRAVILMIGGNDFGPFGMREGADVFNYDAMVARYSDNMRAAAARIRSVAPTAQLVIAGYPQITDGQALCFFNVIPTVPLGVPVPGHAAENALAGMQAAGAAAAGVRFVDNRALTSGHSTCSRNDSRRYVAGIVDTTSPAYPMSLHPTDLGHQALARNNAAAIGF